MPQSPIAALAKVRVKRNKKEYMLFIQGKRKQASPRAIVLVECFLSYKGKIVPYELLFSVMKWRSVRGRRFLHRLRQYIRELKMLFRRERIAAYFAVAELVGYGLCELAISDRRIATSP
jgi:DNA-binding winged helix-turn-helix (wHTH) protein